MKKFMLLAVGIALLSFIFTQWDKPNTSITDPPFDNPPLFPVALPHGLDPMHNDESNRNSYFEIESPPYLDSVKRLNWRFRYGVVFPKLTYSVKKIGADSPSLGVFGASFLVFQKSDTPGNTPHVCKKNQLQVNRKIRTNQLVICVSKQIPGKFSKFWANHRSSYINYWKTVNFSNDISSITWLRNDPIISGYNWKEQVAIYRLTRAKITN